MQPANAPPCIQAFVKLTIPILSAAIFLSGCTTHDRSPEEIRRQTAHATETAARDAKAVAQGVVDGVKQQHKENRPSPSHPKDSDR